MVFGSKWTLGLAAVVVTGLLATGAGSSVAQEGGKPKPKHENPAGGGQGGPAQGQDRDARMKAMTERMTKLKEAVNGAKTSLSTAIATAETSTKGKVISAAYNLGRDGKFTIDVRVLANDKMGSCTVDPETGKASEMKAEEEGMGAGGMRRGGKGGGKGEGEGEGKE